MFRLNLVAYFLRFLHFKKETLQQGKGIFIKCYRPGT